MPARITTGTMQAEESRAEARTATVYLSWIAIASTVPYLLVRWHRGETTWYVAQGVVLATVTLVVATLVPRLPRRASIALFALLCVSANIWTWIGTELGAASGAPFTPFIGLMMFLLLIALLAPSVRSGALLIIGSLLAAVAQYLSWSPTLRERIGGLELSTTILIGAASLALLRARRQQVTVRRDVDRLNAEGKWLGSVSRLAVSVRHLANTPLQTLVLCSRLACSRCAKAASVCDAIDETVGELTSLNKLLAPLDRFFVGRTDKLAIDAQATIRQLVLEGSNLRVRSAVGATLALRDRDQDRQRSSFWFSCCCVSAGSVAWLFGDWHGAPGVALLGLVAAGLVGIVLQRFSLLRTAAAAAVLFAGQAALAITTSWIIDATQAQLGIPFVPFVGAKVLAVSVMLFAPSAVVGIAVIAVASLAPVVQFARWPDALKAQLLSNEPALSVLIGIMATAVLVGQRRVLVRLRRTARDRAERAWLGQVARLMVMVRDLSRLPVQRLREQAARLEADCPESADIVARMLRACGQLNQLNEQIAPFEIFNALGNPQASTRLEVSHVAHEMSDLMTRRATLDERRTD